jgi:hypothetical protein
MLRGLRLSFLIPATFLTGHAQWLNYPAPGIPRTKDGKPDLFAKAPKLAGRPDLSGVWQVEPPAKGEIERMLGGDVEGYLVPGDDIRTFSKYFFNILADLKPQDSPLRPEAAEITRSRQKDRITPDERCLPVGVPRAELIGFPFKIVETPGLMVMLFEGDNSRRQIYTDGRKLPVDLNPAWMGYSVGHWEGDTLVVDSAGFTDKVWIDAFGHPVSESTRVQERFARRDFGHMDLEVTVTDPKMYSRPITFKATELLVPDSDILEYLCTENEKDRAHMR